MVAFADSSLIARLLVLLAVLLSGLFGFISATDLEIVLFKYSFLPSPGDFS